MVEKQSTQSVLGPFLNPTPMSKDHKMRLGLKYGFYKKSLRKDAPLVEHFFHHKRVPFCDEKSVLLVRGASFRSDFLQNPYFPAYFSVPSKEVLE